MKLHEIKSSNYKHKDGEVICKICKNYNKLIVNTKTIYKSEQDEQLRTK